MATISGPVTVSRADIIEWYFYEGYQYRTIVCFLYFVHGITLSLRQLKRELRKMNLHRRVQPSANNINGYWYEFIVIELYIIMYIIL